MHSDNKKQETTPSLPARGRPKKKDTQELCYENDSCYTVEYSLENNKSYPQFYQHHVQIAGRNAPTTIFERIEESLEQRRLAGITLENDQRAKSAERNDSIKNAQNNSPGNADSKSTGCTDNLKNAHFESSEWTDNPGNPHLESRGSLKNENDETMITRSFVQQPFIDNALFRSHPVVSPKPSFYKGVDLGFDDNTTDDNSSPPTSASTNATDLSCCDQPPTKNETVQSAQGEIYNNDNSNSNKQNVKDSEKQLSNHSYHPNEQFHNLNDIEKKNDSYIRYEAEQLQNSLQNRDDSDKKPDATDYLGEEYQKLKQAHIEAIEERLRKKEQSNCHQYPHDKTSQNDASQQNAGTQIDPLFNAQQTAYYPCLSEQHPQNFGDPNQAGYLHPYESTQMHYSESQQAMSHFHAQQQFPMPPPVQYQEKYNEQYNEKYQEKYNEKYYKNHNEQYNELEKYRASQAENKLIDAQAYAVNGYPSMDSYNMNSAGYPGQMPLGNAYYPDPLYHDPMQTPQFMQPYADCPPIECMPGARPDYHLPQSHLYNMYPGSAYAMAPDSRMFSPYVRKRPESAPPYAISGTRQAKPDSKFNAPLSIFPDQEDQRFFQHYEGTDGNGEPITFETFKHILAKIEVKKVPVNCGLLPKFVFSSAATEHVDNRIDMLYVIGAFLAETQSLDSNSVTVAQLKDIIKRFNLNFQGKKIGLIHELEETRRAAMMRISWPVSKSAMENFSCANIHKMLAYLEVAIRQDHGQYAAKGQSFSGTSHVTSKGTAYMNNSFHVNSISRRKQDGQKKDALLNAPFFAASEDSESGSKNIGSLGNNQPQKTVLSQTRQTITNQNVERQADMRSPDKMQLNNRHTQNTNTYQNINNLKCFMDKTAHNSANTSEFYNGSTQSTFASYKGSTQNTSELYTHNTSDFYTNNSQNKLEIHKNTTEFYKGAIVQPRAIVSSRRGQIEIAPRPQIDRSSPSHEISALLRKHAMKNNTQSGENVNRDESAEEDEAGVSFFSF